MKRFTGMLLLCTMLLSALWPQMAFAQAPAPMITSVEVMGIRNLPADAVAQVGEITASLVGKPFNQATVDETVKAIDDLGYFFTVSAAQTPVEGGVRVVFTVTENRIISRVEFNGNISFTDAELLEIIKSQPGQVLNDPLAGQDRQAILEAYAKKGFVYTDVAAPEISTDPNDPTRVVLIFTIYEPTISEIRIVGAKKTRENVIRRYLEFRVGDVVNLKPDGPQQATVRNLRGLGVFESVSITYELGTRPNSLIANVNVQERSTGTASLGVSESQVQGLTGFIYIAENNLFGTLQRISANVRFGGERGYQVSYTNPWIDPRRTSFTVNMYDFSTLREAFLGDQNNGINYKEQRDGGDVTFSRPVDRNTRITLGARYNDIRATEDTLITDPDVRSALLTDYRVISTTLGFVRDTRDYPFSPFSGSYTTFETEAAGLGGTSFIKVSGKSRRYFVVKRDRHAEQRLADAKPPLHWVYAARLMAGTSSGVPPFLDQFFLGGSDTLRGYKQDRFPGENMVLFNNELRVPLNETLGVVGFVDVGDAWSGQFASVFGDRSFKLHYGYGLGLRLMLPAVGPLRLDYGINDEGNSEFTFAFGATF